MKTPRLLLCLAALAAAPLTHAAEHACAPAPAAVAPHEDVEARVETLLSKLTLNEKIAMLGGDETGFNSEGVARLGIPPIRMSDGPIGVRDGSPSTAFPVSANMAATWDTDLVSRYGVALAEETLAKGKNAILGPCVGISRYPLGGRNFEAFGEDPFLSSRMAVSVIKGVQSRKVIATVKHYACNDQEWMRNDYDVVVDERSLRETHLLPFEAAVKEGGAWMLMSAYNIVNGEHMSENQHLLTDILKKEWGYQGLVVSDWVSVYSADKAANHGLDIEMPQAIWLGDELRQAVKDGRVSEKVIDDKIRRHLRVRLQAGLFDNPAPKPQPEVIHSRAHRALAEEIAEKSLVLLKNDGLLPLAPNSDDIALIGPCATIARWGGGGSSYVDAWTSVSPLQGFRAELGEKAHLSSAEAVMLDAYKAAPLPEQLLRTPDGKAQGLLGEYFTSKDCSGAPLFSRIDPKLDFNWGGKAPAPGMDHKRFSIRWTGLIQVPETRDYTLFTTSDDGSWLYIDDKLVVDNGGQHGAVAVGGEIRLQAGKSYRIRIDYQQSGGDASMQIGWKDPAIKVKVPTIAEAVETARKARLVVLCVGNSANQESEGVDVAGFTLPRGQEELVEKVVAANPNTVVVVYGGVPVLMKPWLAKARAVVAALYPGQEGGTALAKLLLGKANFSGKLPFSYIQSAGENPSTGEYKDPSLKVHYAEGVFVGYKYYDAHGVQPLFPFGHGLSYTQFAYADAKAVKTGPRSAEFSVTVSNTGKVAGDEVVQVYVEPRQSKVSRPVRELKGFARVSLKPGESRTVTVSLDERAFSYYDPAAKAWVAEPGRYTLHAAASSRDLRQSATVAFE
jgi:beta-glucosidase